MNKENKKIAQERRAQEREKQQKKNRRKEILANWGPIVIIGVAVVVLVVAIVTSGGSDADEVEEGSEIGFTYIDENGNAMEVTDWTEVDEEEKEEEENELDTTAGTVVEDGDMVNIDYAGYLDGEAFEGGTAEDEDVTVGAGEYIPGFEEGLIGHAVGESFDMPVTFPDGYSDELGGKEVVFKVTINGIYQ